MALFLLQQRPPVTMTSNMIWNYYIILVDRLLLLFISQARLYIYILTFLKGTYSYSTPQKDFGLTLVGYDWLPKAKGGSEFSCH